MSSNSTIFTAISEPEIEVVNIESIDTQTYNKRSETSNQKPNNKPKKSARVHPGLVKVKPLQADDIKEHRLWAIFSAISCFFLISPFFAIKYSKRVRVLKNNQELNQAAVMSHRINNMLVITNIIGGILWFAILVILGMFFIFGAVFKT